MNTKKELQEISDRQWKMAKKFDQLTNARSFAEQKKIMFEIYQDLLDHNEYLSNKVLDLQMELSSRIN